jgi:hypothetical protein
MMPTFFSFLCFWCGLRNRSAENGVQRPGSPSTAIFERNERESKLELFEIDPLVNVRELRRCVCKLYV